MLAHRPPRCILISDLDRSRDLPVILDHRLVVLGAMLLPTEK
jgi:hypothetical protein